MGLTHRLHDSSGLLRRLRMSYEALSSWRQACSLTVTLVCGTARCVSVSFRSLGWLWG